MIWKFK